MVRRWEVRRAPDAVRGWLPPPQGASPSPRVAAAAGSTGPSPLGTATSMRYLGTPRRKALPTTVHLKARPPSSHLVELPAHGGHLGSEGGISRPR